VKLAEFRRQHLEGNGRRGDRDQRAAVRAQHHDRRRADEFGTVVDGTPGEVLKFLPGITMTTAPVRRAHFDERRAREQRPITVGDSSRERRDGGTGRVTNLDQFSVNSIARIEKLDSPRPSRRLPRSLAR